MTTMSSDSRVIRHGEPWNTVHEFFWQWDPAGLRIARNDIPDEYDELVAGLLSLVYAGTSPDEANDWARRRLESDWGVGASDYVPMPGSLRDALVGAARSRAKDPRMLPLTNEEQAPL
jgi:hypothetical protein